MAGNCVAFALYVLRAAGNGNDPKVANVRGLALGAAIFACFIHALSRRGGILLNNALAMFKISVLILIIVTTIKLSITQDNQWANNTGAETFNSQGDVSGYASAFLSIGKLSCTEFRHTVGHMGLE